MHIKKIYIKKKNHQKFCKKIGLLEDLTISLLNINFVMIYIIHKMLVLLKNHMNYLKDSIFEYVFKEYNRLLFYFVKYFFHNI